MLREYAKERESPRQPPYVQLATGALPSTDNMTMPSRSLGRGMQIGITVLVTALLTPVLAQAECVGVPVRPGVSILQGVRDSDGRVVEPTLVFSGTVTATHTEKYTVSFEVARVWRGQLRRETTLFVVPGVEGAGVGSFQTGLAYLVTTYAPTHVFGPEDVASTGLPAGTVGVSFGCIDGPMLLADASEELKRLGAGRLPRP